MSSKDQLWELIEQIILQIQDIISKGKDSSHNLIE